MRLSAEQISNLRKTVTFLIKDVTEIRVFGSRLDNSRIGGDLDLVVESAQRHGIIQKADLKIALERVLGLPVDVLLVTRNGAQSVFERLAMSKSQPLP
jgi:predicted nucleotidyltransferase